MGTSRGRLQDPVAGRPGEQMMGRLGTSAGRRSYMFFKSNTQKHIKLILTCYPRLYSELL